MLKITNLQESVKIDTKHRTIDGKKVSSEGGSFKLTSSAAAFSAQNVGANTILTASIEHTLINLSDVLPISVQADLYVTTKQDGNIINSLSHSFNLNGDSDHRLWFTIGRFHNRQSSTLNQFDIEFQLTNSDSSAHDYWIDYTVFLINFS